MFARKGKCFAVLFALVAGLLLLCSCAASDGVGSGWAPPYFDPEGFSQENGRMAYTRDGETWAKAGVDVSDHQGYIDWDAVAEDGIGFAMIRAGYRGATEAELYQDDYFEYNLQFARAAGLECGVYFFSQAISEEEAREEAQFVLALLNGAELAYPVVFDYEQNAAGIESRIQGVGIAYAPDLQTHPRSEGHKPLEHIEPAALPSQRRHQAFRPILHAHPLHNGFSEPLVPLG
jgi:hypothetical protein